MHLQVVNSDELMGAMRDIGQTFGMAVRPYTATPRAPFESYLSVMARTGVLVSRHGPFLANSIFLPPGKRHSPQINLDWDCFSRSLALLDSEILCWHACMPGVVTDGLGGKPGGLACQQCMQMRRGRAVVPAGAMVVELLPYNWEWKGVSRIYKNITSSMGDIHHFAWRAKHPKWAVYPSQHEARYAEWTAEECVGRCVHTHRGQSTDAGGKGGGGKAGGRQEAHMTATSHASGVVDSSRACCGQSWQHLSRTERSLIKDMPVQALACLTEVSLECCSDCLDVHARAAMQVDVATVQELIVESLPGHSHKACLRLWHALIMRPSRASLGCYSPACWHKWQQSVAV